MAKRRGVLEIMNMILADHGEESLDGNPLVGIIQSKGFSNIHLTKAPKGWTLMADGDGGTSQIIGRGPTRFEALGDAWATVKGGEN